MVDVPATVGWIEFVVIVPLVTLEELRVVVCSNPV